MAPNIVKIGKFRLRQKIAILDYDWTLVRPKSNGTFSKSLDDWTWLTKAVPDVLEKLYAKGFCLIVISNQTRNTELKTRQIENAMSSLSVPSLVIVAYEKSDKKPNKSTFDLVKNMTSKKLDMDNSIFVGDALGRQDDWSDSDKQFADNIGISKIYAPDDIFAVQYKVEDTKIKSKKEQEIIIMVGYPGSGKSTVAASFNNHYKVLHGDELVTSKKMIKEAEKYLKEGYSVIFDATNASMKKRKEFVDIGNKYNLPVRCIVMKTDMSEAMFRNNKRNKVIPKITYYVFRKNYQEPVMDEGFSEIIFV